MKMQNYLTGIAMSAMLVLPTAILAQGNDANAQDGVGIKARLQGLLGRFDEGKHLGVLKNLEKKINHDIKREEKKDAKLDERMRRERTVIGTVKSIEGVNINLLTKNNLTVKISTSGAKFIRHFGATMVIGDIQLNDRLEVKGRMGDDNIFRAQVIRDLSLQARRGTFTGDVTSINAAGQTLVLQSANRGLQTIIVSTTTKIMKNNQPATFANIVVGSRLRVDGVWNNTNNNVAAQRINIMVVMQEVHITGKVTAVAERALTVLGNDGKTYIVESAHATIFFQNYRRMSLSQVHVGDEVDVWGTHESASLTIRANVIRNMTQAKT